MKYKPMNGWTIETIKKALETKNNGTRCATTSACWYRRGNNHCAVGCFIPDDAGDEIFSSSEDVESLLNDYPELAEAMPLPTKALDQLQQVHDLKGDAQDDFIPRWMQSLPKFTPTNLRERMFAWIDQNVEAV